MSDHGLRPSTSIRTSRKHLHKNFEQLPYGSFESGVADQGQIENSICSPPFWEGLGEGRSYGKEKSKFLMCAGFQPAQDLFWGADS